MVGGSTLSIGGALTNSSYLTIGNTALSASDKATAASLDNTGRIYLTGSSANQALLDVTAGSAGFGAAGVLTGTVGLAGDSAIEFASGQITSLAGSLDLNGNDAFIEDSTALGSNSALTGLANVAGSLYLDNGASLPIAGPLTNTGSIYLDREPGGNPSGASTLSIAGALTNAGTLLFSVGDKLTASTLSNTGTISLNDTGTNQALLDVTTGVAGFGTAGTLTGEVSLNQGSAIEFLSGQISTIAAASSLYLYSNSNFVEDSTALGSNSALTGLANVAGSLYLEEGASVSATGALTNTGFIHLDDPYGYAGGSTLSIGSALTNTGTLVIGNSGISSSDTVTAKSFVNRGTVDLTGGTNFAALDVSGPTTNNGSISIASDTEELAGAVGGTGSFSLSAANLLFDSSVSTGQTISESGTDELTLKQAQFFAATISGFGTGDTIDATNFLAPPATMYNFVENTAMTGGTLTLTDTSLSLTANIQVTGVYTKSDFTLAPDSGTGTLVKFV